jgi:hypothetical protein
MEQQLSEIGSLATGFLVTLGQFLPKLIIAIIILVAGWFLAKFLEFLVVRGMKLVNFNVVTDKAGIDGFLKKGGVKKSTIDILGILVYWLVILGTILVAFEALGLTAVTTEFAKIAAFVPKAIVAVLILAIGLYFSRFVGEAVVAYGKNVGMQDADLVGRLTRYAINVFVFIVALSHLSIGESYLQDLFRYIIMGIAAAFAISFGLGGQKWASEQIDKIMKGRGARK